MDAKSLPGLLHVGCVALTDLECGECGGMRGRTISKFWGFLVEARPIEAKPARAHGATLGAEAPLRLQGYEPQR